MKTITVTELETYGYHPFAGENPVAAVLVPTGDSPKSFVRAEYAGTLAEMQARLEALQQYDLSGEIVLIK